MPTKSSPCPFEDAPSATESALALTRAISAGSLVAWHQFLDHYAGLVYRVVKRFLSAEDEDEIRTVYVDVLKSLYDGAISEYRGTALLSSWLFVYTRSRAMDFYRNRFGRLRTPRNFDKLSEYDRKVLKLFYVEKLPLEIVVSVLDWSGMPAGVDDVLKSIHHIEKTLTRRYLDRLDDEFQSQKNNTDSVRMLKYLLNLRIEYEAKTQGSRPDKTLLEQEAMETARKIREAVSSLSEADQKIIHYRYIYGWTARKIASAFSLKSQRQAYHLINRALKKLRATVSSLE